MVRKQESSVPPVLQSEEQVQGRKRQREGPVVLDSPPFGLVSFCILCCVQAG